MGKAAIPEWWQCSKLGSVCWIAYHRCLDVESHPYDDFKRRLREVLFVHEMVAYRIAGGDRYFNRLLVSKPCKHEHWPTYSEKVGCI